MKSNNSIPSLLCNDVLLSRISSNLKNLEVRKSRGQETSRAAVAVTIVEVADDPGVYGMTGNENRFDHAALILTRRATSLKNHSGQWAFPGGRVDKNESSEEAALRELEEEVGLSLENERVIGCLDDFVTRSGFVITPVVIWGGTGLEMKLEPAEVRSAHRIPIEEFMRQDAPILEESSDSENPVLLMPVGQSWIASPTGAIIYQFREVAILGKNTRVAHYEQPFFAWS